jgi:hypothetical protein
MFYGGHGDGATPLPIPNREVKPISADGTAVTVGEYDTAIILLSPSKKLGLFFGPNLVGANSSYSSSLKPLG